MNLYRQVLFATRSPLINSQSTCFRLLDLEIELSFHAFKGFIVYKHEYDRE